ncbi:Reticulon-4-interacting protein 1, mitochondrial [Pseudolycoriella hygida]|uniref:Reticulon-4-interacting protein 1, mitochondrial n=1 Tax=Pseudolycoriella hygida TaxID=35572 RepID=A0A9Q0RTT6_9DIPT|nr:Reticulon-4-interacting protein 1, mitochondrial [Pseudolycoriella hygida]
MLWKRRFALTFITQINNRCIARCASTKSHFKTENDFQSGKKMNGWQIHSYSDGIQFSDKIKIPTIRESNELLVKVNCASVNPIDVAMVDGYGATVFNAMRCKQDSIEFPLTLGRDFSGTIVHKGMAVRNSLQIGDKVWGVVPLHRNGCHSEFVVVDADYVTHKPEKLSDLDAAAILYAGLTAWSGLFLSGQLGGLTGAMTSHGGGRGKRVCILGATGGVGSIAVQIAKAEGAEVVATCANDAVSQIEALGVTHVVDYTSPDASNDLIRFGPYDIILDCAGKGSHYAAEIPWRYQHYVTFTSPTLKNMDAMGLVFGAAKNICDLVQENVKSLTTQQGFVKWAYFVPAPHGIEYLINLVNRSKLLPIVEKVYDFKEADEAYERVAAGHLRGKIVLDLQ